MSVMRTDSNAVTVLPKRFLVHVGEAALTSAASPLPSREWPPPKEFGPISQIYDQELKEACAAFEAEDFDKVNAIASHFLQELDLDDLHAAGFHFILARSSDQHVDLNFDSSAATTC